MKSKLYLVSMCALLACTGNVWGQEFCPHVPTGYGVTNGVVDKSPPPIDGWNFGKWWDNHAPKETDVYTFQTAWLLDIGSNQCNYAVNGQRALALNKLDPNVNATNHKLSPEEVPSTDECGVRCRSTVCMIETLAEPRNKVCVPLEKIIPVPM